MSDLDRSPRAVKVARRLLTIPAYVAAAAIVWSTLPLLLVVTLLGDLVARRRFLLTRLLLILAVYLACELAGLVAAGALWVAGLVGSRSREDRHLDLHWRLQGWWAGAIFSTIRTVLRLDLSVEGAEKAAPGPLLVFVRHASIVDTLLPANVVAASGHLHLRYVLKKELQWDPCLDVVGNRLPNAFVDRESPDSRAEIALVCRLAREMGAADGILIYPEGTRFTAAKRERALARIGERSPGLLERARGLRHVLPPKVGGPLGLLEANPNADVLFVGHVGLDGLARVRHLWDPTLVGRRVEVKLWRVPRAEIPEDRERRTDWLFERWGRIDTWIDERLEARLS